MKIIVRKGEKEISIEMELKPREVVKVDRESSPRGILDMVKELVEQINNVK